MPSLREALARVVSDQRREPDDLVDDIYTVLREYGRVGYLHDGSLPHGVISWDNVLPDLTQRVIVLPMLEPRGEST